MPAREEGARWNVGKGEPDLLSGRTEIVEVATRVVTLIDAPDRRKEAEALSTEEPTNVMPLVDPARRDEVRFESEGLTLAGHVYRARAVPEGERTPALVMAGPMTSVKEETLPHYAESLQDAGYTVFAFDNRNFGESAGEPRQHLDTHEQVEDLKNAVSYMLSRQDTDPERIGLCCVCLGAGYGLKVAAMDQRIRAVALVAGGYNITDTYLGFLGPDGFRDYIENLGVARQHQYESGRSSTCRQWPARPTSALRRCRWRRHTRTTLARKSTRRPTGRTD